MAIEPSTPRGVSGQPIRGHLESRHLSFVKRRKLTPAERAAFTRAGAVSWGLIDPRTNRWLPYWDVLMLFSLAFTATFTPYEVTFLTEADVQNDGPDAVWVMNRVVDSFFMIDIVLVCSTMYEEELEFGGMWVVERSKIVRKYVSSGWFYIDVIAVFPFYLIGWAINGGSGADSSGDDDSGGSNTFHSVRLIKLLRMLKFARVLKASTILKRHLQQIIMGYMELTYSVLQGLELLAILLVYAHLQACLYALFSSFTDGPTWIDAFKDRHVATLTLITTPSALGLAPTDRMQPRALVWPQHGPLTVPNDQPEAGTWPTALVTNPSRGRSTSLRSTGRR